MESSNEMETRAARLKKFIFFAAGMAGLLFGLDQGVISGALPFISKEWNLDIPTQEWVVSSMTVGAACGAFLASFLAKGIGRRKSIMTGAVLFLIACIGSGTATNVDMLIYFRILLGISVGIASYTAPLYLAEMSSKNSRGKIILGYQLMVVTGILVAFLSDTFFSYSGDWRMMLMVIAIPAVFLFVTLLSLPESPRWLAVKGRLTEAEKILNHLSGNFETAKIALEEIKDSLKIKQEGWTLFKTNPNVRRIVLLGIVLQAMQQLAGINFINYYSPEILRFAGFASTEEQMIGTVLNGLTFFLATIIAVNTVDKFGRRPLLKYGFGLMGIAMIALGICLKMINEGATGFISYFAALMLMLSIAAFAFGAGGVVWVLCSEIQPLKSREFGVACSTMANWIVCGIVGSTFLSLMNGIGSDRTFWLYGGLNLLFVLITIKYVPETKGITLERIEKNLMSGKKLKDIGC